MGANLKKLDNYRKDSLVGAILGFVFRIALAVAAIIVIYKGITYCYDFGFRIFNEPAMTEGIGRVVTVSIEEDMSPIAMGKMMEEKGLSRDWKLFAVQYYCSEYKEEIQPGVYELNTNMTAEEMFGYIASFYRPLTPIEEKKEVLPAQSVEEIPLLDLDPEDMPEE